jgi:hypothetical protein
MFWGSKSFDRPDSIEDEREQQPPGLDESIIYWSLYHASVKK